MSAQPAGGAFTALRNGLSVLRAFSPGKEHLGVVELAALTGLHKSTVSRLLGALEDEGLVERDPESRRYRLGLGLVQLAGPLLGALEVRDVARPLLRDLRDATGESAALAVWTGNEALIVEHVESVREISHTTPIGAPFRTAVSASVQVFLAQLPDEEVLSGLASGRFVFPSAEPEEHRHYLEQLRESQAQGVFINDRRSEADVVGAAAPVHDHRGDLVGAVLVAAPAYRIGEAGVDLLARAVRSCAQHASTRMGNTG